MFKEVQWNRSIITARYSIYLFISWGNNHITKDSGLEIDWSFMLFVPSLRRARKRESNYRGTGNYRSDAHLHSSLSSSLRKFAAATESLDYLAVAPRANSSPHARSSIFRGNAPASPHIKGERYATPHAMANMQEGETDWVISPCFAPPPSGQEWLWNHGSLKWPLLSMSRRFRSTLTMQEPT